MPHPSEPVSRFQCAVPGCGRWLGSVLEQEVHYSTSHRHGCGLCRAQLPSFHLLQLHLEESHDSLFAVRAQRQPMVSERDGVVWEEGGGARRGPYM